MHTLVSGLSVSNNNSYSYKAKIEKRLGVTLRQSYVTRIMTMLNTGMIPTGNSDIIHRFLLGKTRPGEEIQNWKTKTGMDSANNAAR